MAKPKIVVLVEKEYEDLEFWYPYFRLKEAEADVVIVAPEAEKEYLSKHGYPVKSQLGRDEAVNREWDGVIIPGGWAPDRLRRYPEILALVKKINQNNGLVAAICHGGSVMVSADIVKGRRMTSFIAIKDDLIHAGAEWVDQPVVIEGNFVTAQTPADTPEFMKAVMKLLKP